MDQSAPTCELRYVPSPYRSQAISVNGANGEIEPRGISVVRLDAGTAECFYLLGIVVEHGCTITVQA